MKVFISWSGDRSLKLATALSEWLPQVIQVIEPFISSGIQFGVRWLNTIGEQLDATSFGIICVTPENQLAPWLMFEAGALSKSVEGAETRVVPIGLGFSKIADIGEHFTQFQAMLPEREQFAKLIEEINTAAGAPLKPHVLTAAFDVWWPALETAIAQAAGSAPAVPSVRSDSDKISELLDLVRSMARPPATIRVAGITASSDGTIPTAFVARASMLGAPVDPSSIL